MAASVHLSLLFLLSLSAFLYQQRVYCTRLLPNNSVFNQDITNATLDPESSQIIQNLTSWGPGATALQIDFSFHILTADANTPQVQFVRTPGYTTPDCDYQDMVPLPVGGMVEGQTNYSCDTQNNDCHLLIVDKSANILYEFYHTTLLPNGSLTALCLIKWDLCRNYPENLRGDQCTSADAAGFPIAPLLFTADEVASGVIDHAIRFILPNKKMRKKTYVHPASHAGAPQSDSPAIIYGQRLRLKSTFNDSKFSTAAKVVIAALKKYGMFLSDGGNIPLCAQNDTFTTAKWADLNFDSHSLFGISPSDFDVVLSEGVSATRQVLTYNCNVNVFNTSSQCDANSNTTSTSGTPTTTSTSSTSQVSSSGTPTTTSASSTSSSQTSSSGNPTTTSTGSQVSTSSHLVMSPISIGVLIAVCLFISLFQ